MWNGACGDTHTRQSEESARGGDLNIQSAVPPPACSPAPLLPVPCPAVQLGFLLTHRRLLCSIHRAYLCLAEGEV